MTSLSVGKIVYKVLTDCLGDKVTKIFPIYASNASLPYVAYRQSGMNETFVKNGIGPDVAIVEVAVFASSYDEMNELSEEIRAFVDNKRFNADGLEVRCVTLIDAREQWADDAYIKTMVYYFKI